MRPASSATSWANVAREESPPWPDMKEHEVVGLLSKIFDGLVNLGKRMTSHKPPKAAEAAFEIDEAAKQVDALRKLYAESMTAVKAHFEQLDKIIGELKAELRDFKAEIRDLKAEVASLNAERAQRDRDVLIRQAVLCFERNLVNKVLTVEPDMEAKTVAHLHYAVFRPDRAYYPLSTEAAAKYKELLRLYFEHDDERYSRNLVDLIAALKDRGTASSLRSGIKAGYARDIYV